VRHEVQQVKVNECLRSVNECLRSGKEGTRVQAIKQYRCCEARKKIKFQATEEQKCKQSSSTGVARQGRVKEQYRCCEARKGKCEALKESASSQRSGQARERRRVQAMM